MGMDEYRRPSDDNFDSVYQFKVTQKIFDLLGNEPALEFPDED